MPNENLELDTGETPLPRLKPPVVRSKAVKPLLYTSGILLVLAGAFGYYAWHLRGKRSALATDNADLEKKLAKIGPQHESCERDLKRKNSSLTECRGDRKSAKARATRAETKLAKLENETLVGMKSRLKATSKELDQLRKARAKQEKRLRAFRDLTARFQEMISAGKLEVLVRNGNMLVKLPAGVLFDVARADLSTKGERALMEVGVVLKKMKKRFLIVGHTDNRPLRTKNYKNNWELSLARALTVTEFLLRVGVPGKNLIAAGRGEYDPVASNSTRAGRQKNRRIEIIVMPDLGDMPELPKGLTKDKKAKPKKG